MNTTDLAQLRTTPVFANRFPSLGRVKNGGFLVPPANEDPLDAKDDQGHGEDRPPNFKPELVIRTYPGDAGARPLAGGIMFWESPDIWVVSPNGDDIPVAGKINTVNVHVWNMGLATCYGVHVDLFWCNPSVGVNLAASNQIGMQGPFTLQAGEHRVFGFNWTPVFANNGHECLVAHVYDPVSDNLVAPFNPVQDRHCGQRNVNVVVATAGRQVILDFFAANLSQNVASSTIRVEALYGAALETIALALGRDAVLSTSGGTALISQTAIRKAKPRIDLNQHLAAAVFRESLEPVPQRLGRTMLGAALTALPAPKKGRSKKSSVKQKVDRPNAERGQASVAATLQPGHEMALTLTVTLPRKANPGTAHVYRVIEEVDGVITGGITYVVHGP